MPYLTFATSSDGPALQVLLGQDVLAEGLFLLDGPRRHFLLGF